MTLIITAEFIQSATSSLTGLTDLLRTTLARRRARRQHRLLMEQLRAMPNELLRDMGIDPASVPAPRPMDCHPHLIAISQGGRPSRLPTSSR